MAEPRAGEAQATAQTGLRGLAGQRSRGLMEFGHMVLAHAAFTASAGVGVPEPGTDESQPREAQFSAPGFGQSSGVGFGTLVTNGTSGLWSTMATQPLYELARWAQQQQLNAVEKATTEAQDRFRLGDAPVHQRGT